MEEELMKPLQEAFREQKIAYFSMRVWFLRRIQFNRVKEEVK